MTNCINNAKILQKKGLEVALFVLFAVICLLF